MSADPSINRKTVINSLWWKVLERSTVQIFNLAVQIVLARMIAPAKFGQLAIIVAIINYAALFVQSGIGTAIVQKVDLHKEDINTLFTFSLTFAFIFYIVIFFSSPWIANAYSMQDLIWPLRVLALILFLNAISAIQTALLSRKMQFKTLFLRSLIAVPVSGLIGILMAYKELGIWALVAQNLINMGLVVLVMYMGTEIRLSIGFNYHRFISLFSFSGRVLLSTLVSGFGDTIRTMTIGKKFSSSNLAYYDKANTYSGYVTQIANASISSVLLPALSKRQENKAHLKSMARQSVGLTAFVMIPLLTAVAVAAKPLVLILLTDKWADSIPLLMIFCFLRIPYCLTTIDKQVYYAIGNSRIGLYYEIGLFLATITMLIITVPISLMAISIGALIIELIACVVLFVVSSRIYGYSLKERFSDISKPIISSIIIAGIIWVIGLTQLDVIYILLFQMLSGIVIYFIMMQILKDKNYIIIKSILINNSK